MISERDLLEAIAECQGVRNPNANTCIKLAAFYTIYNNMYGNDESETEQSKVPKYSYAASKDIRLDSETEFAEMIKGADIEQVLKIIDELMSTLQILNPKLYNGVIGKIADL